MTIIAPEYVDIGFGCRCESSSGINENLVAHRLQPALKPGGYFFHTAFEAKPWLLIDLGTTRWIDRLRVYAREENGDKERIRSFPLVIETSQDGSAFSLVVQHAQMFGGRLTNAPLDLAFIKPLICRFVRLTSLKADFFHLDYVEVLAAPPQLRNGTAINTVQTRDARIVCDYVHQGNSGLYSALSTALSDISTLSSKGLDVRAVDFGMSFLHFKVKSSENVYAKYFANKSFTKFDECGLAAFHWSDVHKTYRDLDLSSMQKLALNYFQPSEELEARVETLRQQLVLDLDRTLAIVYRGTDKSTEVTLAQPSAYINAAKMLTEVDSTLQVLVQTDQEQARSEIMAAYEGNCSYFAQLPTSNSNQAIHLDFARVATPKTGDKDEWALNMMAVVVLLSRVKYLVTHTGNVSAWICFYRGTSEGVYQFDKHGVLVEPPHPLTKELCVR